MKKNWKRTFSFVNLLPTTSYELCLRISWSTIILVGNTLKFFGLKKNVTHYTVCVCMYVQSKSYLSDFASRSKITNMFLAHPVFSSCHLGGKGRRQFLSSGRIPTPHFVHLNHLLKNILLLCRQFDDFVLSSDYKPCSDEAPIWTTTERYLIGSKARDVKC